MNTGVQRSSARRRRPRAPPRRRPSAPTPGNVFGTGKNVPLIAMAHSIPYVATATVANLHDLERKVTKAMAIHGARYIHIHRALPARLGLGVRTTRSGSRGSPSKRGLFPLFEAEHGEVTASSQDPAARFR